MFADTKPAPTRSASPSPVRLTRSTCQYATSARLGQRSFQARASAGFVHVLSKPRQRFQIITRLLRVLVRQRREDDGVGEAEDGRAGRDPEGERARGERGEARRLQEQAPGVAQVVAQGVVPG